MPRFTTIPRRADAIRIVGSGKRVRIGAHHVSLLRRVEGGPKGGLNFSVVPNGLKLSHKIIEMVPRRGIAFGIISRLFSVI